MRRIQSVIFFAFLILTFSSSAQDEDLRIVSSYYEFEEGSTEYLYGDNVVFRAGPSTSVKAIDTLSIGSKIKIVRKTEEIEEKREIIQTEYKKPQGGQAGWIILAYISAFLGGILGLIIGYFIWQAKNKLPSGEKVYAYTKETRFHGMIIFFISAVIFPVVFIYKMTVQF